MLLRGEITTLDHYRFLEGKTKGARSTPYYSIEPNYLLLPYFITTIHIINKKSYKKQKKNVTVCCPQIDLSSCK
jgi:hypothetical protein